MTAARTAGSAAVCKVVFTLKVIPIKLLLDKVSSPPAYNVFIEDENTTKADWALSSVQSQDWLLLDHAEISALCREG